MPKKPNLYVIVNGQQPGTYWPVLNADGSLRLFTTNADAYEAMSKDVVASHYGFVIRRV